MTEYLCYKTSKIIFNDPEYSDTKFLFEEEMVYGHRTVLLIECPKLVYFIESGRHFGGECFVMENVNVVVFKEFLKFLYFGSLDEQLQLNYFSELISLSEKFNKPELKEMIRSRLGVNVIKYKNAVQILQIGLHNEFNEIVKNTLEFIGRNFSLMLKHYSFLSADVTTIKEILKIDRVDISFHGEMEVFHRVMLYLQINPDKSKDFRDLIRSIRFPTMNNHELVKCFKQSGQYLDETEKLEIFIEINGGVQNNSGFSNAIRMSERQVIPTNKYLTILIHEFHYGCQMLSSTYNNTTFVTKNDQMIITHINVAKPCIYSDKVTVQLKNEFGQILSSGRVDGVTNEDVASSKISVKVDLLPVLQLSSYKIYELVIVYDSGINVINSYSTCVRNLKMPHYEVNGPGNCRFDILSPLLHSIGVQGQ